MSALTIAQADTIAAQAFNKYLPADSSWNLNSNSLLLKVLNSYVGTPEDALKLVAGSLLYQVAYANPSAFPGYTVTVGQTNASTFVQSLPSSMVVNFLDPNGSAADKAAMVSALDSGQITKESFTFGLVKLGTTNTTPTLADVTKAATVAGLPASYPDSGLHVPGVTASQQDFVVAMYNSAFNRAPEYGGLKYWANKLTVELGYGTDQTTAYAVISKQMYIDGKGNGEGGTALADTAYVNYAYQNILGRAGEAAGVAYWNNKLATGTVDRGSFVAKFVGDALGNAGDGDFLQARIAVSKYAAQEHVSGPSAPGIDLHAVIQNVTDAASANAEINAIIQKYGTAAAHDASVAAVELTGVASTSGHDIFSA